MKGIWIRCFLKAHKSVIPNSSTCFRFCVCVCVCFNMWRLKVCKTKWLMESGNKAHPVEMDKEQQRQFHVLLPWDSSCPACCETFVAKLSVPCLCGVQVPSICHTALLPPFSSTAFYFDTWEKGGASYLSWCLLTSTALGIVPVWSSHSCPAPPAHHHIMVMSTPPVWLGLDILNLKS